MQAKQSSNRALMALAFLLLSVGSAFAQYPPRPYPAPPARGVRVQYISGEASYAQCDVDKWAAVALNQSLGPNSCVWTDKNSRAELSAGFGFIRMDSETSLTFLSVNPSTMQLRVNQGTVSVSVGRLGRGEIYEIDTPNATLTLMKSGVYRVDVFPGEDQTWVTVRRGSLAATGNGRSVKVEDGQQVRFRGGNSLQHTAEKAPAPDGFDDWARVRDDRLGVFRSGPYFVGIGPYWGPYPAPPPPSYWGPNAYWR